jgi:hypothetical protein
MNVKIAKQIKVIAVTLWLMVMFCPLYCLAVSSTINTNFGSMFEGSAASGGNPSTMGALQNANSAFIGAGCLIIICAMVGGIKSANDPMSMLFAIVNPLILTVLMGCCMDGNSFTSVGLCTEASNLGNGLATNINPALFNGPNGTFSLSGLYVGSGANQGIDALWGALKNAADSSKQAATANPDDKVTPVAAPPGFFNWITSNVTSAFNWVSAKTAEVENALHAIATADWGAILLSALLDGLYMILYAIVQVICMILLLIASVVMDIMLTLQQFLLLLSSVFLPLFIAGLSLGATQSIGRSYIMSCISIASWPMGWAAGHIGTIALNQMALSNVNNMVNSTMTLSSVLTAFIILLALPFWIIVVTLSAPFVMGKMLTEGSNFASGIASSAGQMAASTLGSGAKAAAGMM